MMMIVTNNNNDDDDCDVPLLATHHQALRGLGTVLGRTYHPVVLAI